MCVGFSSKSEGGFIFVATLIMMTFFISVGLAVSIFGSSHYKDARRTYFSGSALAVAEAGADAVMVRLNDPPHNSTSCPGPAIPSQVFNDAQMGQGRFDVITNTPSSVDVSTPAQKYKADDCRYVIEGEVRFPHGGGPVVARRRVRFSARTFDGGTVWEVWNYEQVPNN